MHVMVPGIRTGMAQRGPEYQSGKPMQVDFDIITPWKRCCQQIQAVSSAAAAGALVWLALHERGEC